MRLKEIELQKQANKISEELENARERHLAEKKKKSHMLMIQ